MSNLTSVREIELTLDITKAVQPANSFYIYRGDQVKFSFNFYNGENKISLSDGTLRVFSKKIGKNGNLDLNTSPLFAKDQAFNSSDGSPTINFQSIETAGEAGHYALCVMFFESSESEIKTTQLVYFDLLENGYAGSYQPTEDYRDEVLDALQKTLDAEARAEAFFNDSVEQIQNETSTAISSINTTKTEKVAEAETEITTAKDGAVGEIETAGANAVNEVNAATEEAKAVIDGWTEQSARLAKAESAISLLQADKLNRGALWFNKVKIATATNNATTLPLTLCATVECDDWSGLKNISGAWNGGREFTFLNSLKVQYSPERFCGFNFGIGSQTGNAWTELLLLLGDNNAGGNYAANTAAYNIPDSKKITVCTTISEIENFSVKFYVDGALLKTSANKPSTLASNTIGGASIIATGNYGYATSIPQSKVSNVKVSRLKIFNCVLPATKADDTNGIGYTVEDYHNGIDEPPTMHDASATYRALLSLQDYTILNGSTQQVFDVSGNANDATATLSDGGSLKGSNDIAVSRLIDFIKGQSA